MAAKTLYLLDALASGAGHMALQDGGSAPTTARISTGWVVGTVVAARYARMDAQTERASSAHTTTVQPSGAPDNTLGDCFRTQNALSGAFDAANWSFSFEVLGESRATSTHGGRLRIRVWRSTNADGSAATEMTTATQVTSSYAALNNSTAQTITLTWAGSAVTLTNEYLFVQVAHEITTAGNNANSDTHLRVGSANSVTTANFTPAAPLSASASGASTSSGTAAARLVRRASASAVSASSGAAAATRRLVATSSAVSMSTGTATGVRRLQVLASAASFSTGTAAARVSFLLTAAGASLSSGSASAATSLRFASEAKGGRWSDVWSDVWPWGTTSTGVARVSVLYRAAASAASLSSGDAAAFAGIASYIQASEARGGRWSDTWSDIWPWGTTSEGSASATVVKTATASGGSTSTGSASPTVAWKATASGQTVSAGVAGATVPTWLARASASSYSTGVSQAERILGAGASALTTSAGTAAARLEALLSSALGSSTSSGSAFAVVLARASGSSASSGSAAGDVQHVATTSALATSTGTAIAALVVRADASATSVSDGTAAALLRSPTSSTGSSSTVGTATAIITGSSSASASGQSTGSALALRQLVAAADAASTSAGFAAAILYLVGSAGALSTSSGTATVRPGMAGRRDVHVSVGRGAGSLISEGRATSSWKVGAHG